jgi:peptide/nickel transport system permease protein
MTAAPNRSGPLARVAAPKREAAPLGQFAVEFFESRVAAIGLALLVFVLLLAVFAPWLSPQDPYDLSRLDILDGGLRPGSKSVNGSVFLLGSDKQGRDMLSAILYGLRISLGIGVMSGAIALAIGGLIGLIAAYCGGRIDSVIMRLVDLQLSFPSILVALMLLALFGRGIEKTLLALIIVQWAYFARTIRASAMVEQGKDYISAAKGLGLGHWRILWRHLLPNSLPPLIVVGTVQIAHAISLEATLSFLGIGLPITEPSLGLLIANGFDYIMSGKYWISVFPGIALLIAIASINIVGDQLRDMLNPRLKR